MELTPIQEIHGLRVKRDDLYCPYGAGGVNGGKLRQCEMLVDSVNPSGLVTYCSIGSPQAPIVAAVGKARGIPVTVFYGGTSIERLRQSQMPLLVAHYGGQIRIAAKTGRHNVLHSIAKRVADENGHFLVQYGINLADHSDVLLSAVAAQVENLPDCKNLVAVCGSGITASGILIGIKQFGKRVENIHLVATAPDRREFIKKNVRPYHADRDFIIHDLFHSPGFSYDKKAFAHIGRIRLHPNYEAKAYLWYKGSGLKDEDTVFWITGAEPREVRCYGRSHRAV